VTPFTIRRAAIGDEPVVRALRIEALTESPWAFGSTLEREFGRTTADWQRWFSPGVTLVLEAGDLPRGLVAGVHDKDRRGVVHLMAMWVHRSLRASGAADALVTALLDWAAAEGATEITLCIAKGNDRAQRCYERNGFRATGVESAGGRPGFVEVEMVRSITN
jgi:ribosomal protein S18 acetylase RimI-like enzyme